MFSSGFASRTTRSASFPASMLPRSLSEPDALGAQNRGGAERVVLGQPAGLHRPELPVIPYPVELSVRADTGAPARAEQVRDELRVVLEDVLAVAEPPRARAAAPRPLGGELVVGREVRHLRIVEDVFSVA
jgi:hypothetical protein